jgi:hypothetical protein
MIAKTIAAILQIDVPPSELDLAYAFSRARCY